MVPLGHGLLPPRPRKGPPYSISQTQSALPYITDRGHPTLYHGTVRPNLYHRHGPSYFISWNGSPYSMTQTRSTLPYITDTVHPTLYHGTVRPTLYYGTVSPTLCHRHGPPYPISQTRSILPYIMQRPVLPYIRHSLPYSV